MDRKRFSKFLAPVDAVVALVAIAFAVFFDTSLLQQILDLVLGVGFGCLALTEARNI